MMEETTCSACHFELEAPYIHCIECLEASVDLCLQCFARGSELGSHQSDHKYTVVKDDFPLFNKYWTAAEELKLLDALGECGAGNWADVAHIIQTKSRYACESHYNKYYLENPVPELPQMPEPEQTFFPAPMPFCPSENPPRPLDGSALQLEMSGYMPARGDFTVEYNNYAEMNMRDILLDDDGDPLLSQLEMVAVNVYRNVLKERVRRKRVIKNLGLINVKKTLSYNRVYQHTLGHNRMDSMRVFQKMMKQLDWDMYQESWHYEIMLKQCIEKLQEYRDSGLTKFSSATMYDHLRHRRNRERNKRHSLSDVITNLQDKWSCNQWLKKQALMNKVAKGEVPESQIAPIIRKPSVPLDIIGLPGYDKLNSKERVVCSNVRLVPESYLDFKHSLMTECRKVGFLRLAQARNMIKIDVNKTRKIYDFLVEEGLVTKEPISK